MEERPDKLRPALIGGALIGINTMVVGGDLGVAIPSHVIAGFTDQIPAPHLFQRAGSHATI